MFSVFMVLGVQGAGCSGHCVIRVFRVLDVWAAGVFRGLGGLGCWVFSVLCAQGV